MTCRNVLVVFNVFICRLVIILCVATMESGTVSGIVDDTEDSDVSLLVVNDGDGDEYVTGDDDDACLRIPDATVSDGNVLAPVTCLESEAMLPLSTPSAGDTTQDAVVITQNDASFPRLRRSYRHRRRSLLPLMLSRFLLASCCFRKV